jgi:hypothetical protein
MRKIGILISAGLLTASGAEPVASAPAATNPTAIVQRAFDRMLNYPSVRTVRLRIQLGSKATLREFDVIYKRFEGRGHTLVRFREPEYLRNDGLLLIESPDGRNTDTFLYQDALHRVRRVSTEQKADAFYGSDLTFEDLEHHDWRRFELRRLPDELEQGRACRVIEAFPKDESQYTRLRIWVEKKRAALLRIDFFKGRSATPIKTLSVPADEIEEEDGVLKPRRLFVRQVGRDSHTEMLFLRTETDVAITEKTFSAAVLERTAASLYKLAEPGKDGMREGGER